MSSPAVPADLVTIAPDVGQAPPVASANTCAGCGRELLGDFCHACGERRLRADEMTLRAFVRDVASEVADLDSRAYRSARGLLTQPGFLTAEWVAGRRRAYVGPLRLFVAMYAAVLLASAMFASPGAEAVERLPEGSWMRRLLEAIGTRHGWTSGEALERLNATLVSHMGWLQLLIPLLFGTAAALVFVRRRRGFVAHLVFGAHVAAFECAFSLLLLPVVAAAERFPAALGPVVTVLSLGVLGWYLWRAVERVYGDAGRRGAVRAAVLLLGFGLAQGVASGIAFGTAVAALLYL